MSDRYPSVRLEGGLLSAEVIDEVAAGSLPGQRPADFGYPGSRPFIDEVAPGWAEALAQWKTFRAAVDRRPPDAGFALDNHLDNARRKLVSKNLDMICLNDVGQPGAGFDVDTNQLTLVTNNSVSRLPMLSKREAADRLIDAILLLRKAPV